MTSRIFGLPDPHSYGSGNPGATNVLRTGNKAAAVLTLAGDGVEGLARGGPGAVARPRVRNVADWTVPAVALAVFVGHLFPVFHGFAGGKGVATAAGIVFALHWPLGIALAAALDRHGVRLQDQLARRARRSGAGADRHVLRFRERARPRGRWSSIALLLVWRHKSNIRQLLEGKERSIGR